MNSISILLLIITAICALVSVVLMSYLLMCVFRLQNDSTDINSLNHDDDRNDQDPIRYLAVHHRAFGESLYFGPFDTFKDLQLWTTEAELSGVGYTELINPYEWSKLSYHDRWSYPRNL